VRVILSVNGKGIDAYVSAVQCSSVLCIYCGK